METELLNTAFVEQEQNSPVACVECGSTHMEQSYDTSFCSPQCHTVFFNFINNHCYDFEPIERQVFANAGDEDEKECEYDNDCDYDDDECEYDNDDGLSCASDETFLSIYTYESYGKHRIRQLKDRFIVKISEKYGSSYNTRTV